MPETLPSRSLVAVRDQRERAIQLLTDSFAGDLITLEEFEERLTALDGFGPWTAHVVALRAFGEGDAFPEGDLGLVRALERAGVKRTAIAARAERWRPYRAYATLHLWASLADGKGGA